MHNYKDLKVWQKARILVKECYRLTESYPDSEKFGIVSQIRRSSVSICANIAEGSGRNTEKEFLNFLKISRGSSFETETLIILSFDLGYLSETNFDEMIKKTNEIQRMLHGLIKSFEKTKVGLDT